uniref:Uncharacterized protein n=1 Tax=viral metagenome TaxID=1070528 RepID=A0A6M3K4E7_9ZZZZ
MDTVKVLRELASNDDWQNIYILSKDIASIKLFDNCNEFTYVQNIFLRYLNFYYTLHSDVAMGEVDEIVFDNQLYEDAYIMYKNRIEKEKFKGNTTDRGKENINSLKTNSWIFKNPPANLKAK